MRTNTAPAAVPRIGHNRPPEPEYEQVIIQTARRVLENLKDIPEKITKMILRQQTNMEIKPCCRELKNLAYDVRKTKAEYKRADLIVVHCDCGSKHYNLMLGGMGEKG